MQNFRYVPFTASEMLGIQLNENNNEKRNWRNKLFTIFPILMVSFKPNFRSYILTLAIILLCQKWIITESESANQNFRMYRHNCPRSMYFVIGRHYILQHLHHKFHCKLSLSGSSYGQHVHVDTMWPSIFSLGPTITNHKYCRYCTYFSCRCGCMSSCKQFCLCGNNKCTHIPLAIKL